MSKPRDDRQKDLLLPALDQIIDMGHPLVRLAGLIDWKFLDDRFGSVCQTGPGTDARLMHRAITKLVGFAKRNRVPLRQSYLRLAKRAAIMVGRHTHAHQFKRARRVRVLQGRLRNAPGLDRQGAALSRHARAISRPCTS